MTISNRFAKIFSDVPKQINETFEYYKKNNMSQRMIESFKSNIKNVPIDKKIKDFIIENNINTLEQLLIQNPIDWGKYPINDIKKVSLKQNKKDSYPITGTRVYHIRFALSTITICLNFVNAFFRSGR